MSSTQNPALTAIRDAFVRMRRFWERLTEGFELEQLWGQFLSEARASYGLYSGDVDWAAIGRETKKWKRPFLVSWALFQAMLMKLTPARRVLLLLALILLVFQFHVHFGPKSAVNLAWFGAAILFLLLALELADRVTMKRDLEIAREIQQWLVPAHPPRIPGVDIAFATLPQNTIAGDYYDAFLRPLPSASGARPLLIAVADVAGKSVPAALLMATFQASLRALSETPASLEETVVGLDRYARAHSLGGRRFTTAFLAEIDPVNCEMTLSTRATTRRSCCARRARSNGSPPWGRRLACPCSTARRLFIVRTPFNFARAICFLSSPTASSKRRTKATSISARSACSSACAAHRTIRRRKF